MKTSRYALAAIAGLMMGGAYAAPVKAADLGGNCCADLEERVAELEATTVRKGNRKVSLTLSGHVNRALMWYDDGSMTGFRSVDGIQSHSRFRLQGNAKINADWTMGYYQEFEFSTASNSAVSQLDDRGFNSAGGNLQTSSPFNFAIRQSHWFLKNARLGTVSVGRLNMATKDMPGTELGGMVVADSSDMMLNMNNFLLRPAGTTGRQGLSNVRASAFRTQSSADNLRTDGVRYDSPTIMGFTLSTAFGDDYLWDVALRHEAEWNGFKFASATGYYVDMDEACIRANAGTAVGCEVATVSKTGRREQHVFKSNSSVWHMPSGVFASWAYWNLSYDGAAGIDNVTANRGGGQRPDSDMFWVAAGLKRNFFGIGYTSIFGQYGRISNALDGTAQDFRTPDGNGLNFVGGLSNSDVTKWGVGIVQNIDAAAAELYLHYMNYSFDVAGCTVAAVNCTSVKQDIEDIRSVQAGARIKF